MTEELKRHKACYCHGAKSIVIVEEVNDFQALMLFKGALIADPPDVARVERYAQKILDGKGLRDP